MLNAHICSHFPFHFGVMFSFLLLVLRRVQTFQYQKKPLKTSRAKTPKRLKRITSILIESGKLYQSIIFHQARFALKLMGFPDTKGFPISLPKKSLPFGGPQSVAPARPFGTWELLPCLTKIHALPCISKTSIFFTQTPQ